MYIHKTDVFITDPIDNINILRQEVKISTGINMRRVNKFILFSLLGAYKCAEGFNLERDTAIYLTTENGNLEDTEKLLEQMYHKNSFPMPYGFINTMSNTVPFYIAKSMGFIGTNLTISSQNLSFEKGLELLRADFKKNYVNCALIGGVDDVVFSEERFIEKFNEPLNDIKLIEGSCWFLVKNEKSNTIGEFVDIKSFYSEEKLKNWLETKFPNDYQVISFGKIIKQDEKDRWKSIINHEKELDYISENGYFDSVTSLGINVFLGKHKESKMIHINKDLNGHYAVILVDSY